MTTRAHWLTNDREAARMLREADLDYAIAIADATGLPLADKIIAHRAARAERDAAYALAAMAGGEP